jgi:hypothetical protein
MVRTTVHEAGGLSRPLFARTLVAQHRDDAPCDASIDSCLLIYYYGGVAGAD